MKLSHVFAGVALAAAAGGVGYAYHDFSQLQADTREAIEVCSEKHLSDQAVTFNQIVSLFSEETVTERVAEDFCGCFYEETEDLTFLGMEAAPDECRVSLTQSIPRPK